MSYLFKERRIIEGSHAVAEAVKIAKPGVIAAFPITPQTHIVEYLGQLIADGQLKGKYILADSEFSAASIIYGASATGVRSYTASSSQGLLLMFEVLFNMAGTRLPAVFTAVNRSLSPPINIQIDHQDTLSFRDTGIIQIYVENIQEAYNSHLQAFRICEDKKVLLPIFICMDGFILTHAYEPVRLLPEEAVKNFIPDFNPPYQLDPKKPLTYGSLSGADNIMEFRYMTDQALSSSKEVIKETALAFKEEFGMFHGDLIEEYETQNAQVILIGMGSMVATMKEAIDRINGQKDFKVGLVKVRSYRPFPWEEIYQSVKHAEVIAVLDRNVSFGVGGILANEIKASFYSIPKSPPVISYIAGLGGRDINMDTIEKMVQDIQIRTQENRIPQGSIYYDLKTHLLPD